ncbi:MAG: N-acetylglucosamine-6-phosphate deacetylase [Acholeplasma sp.]|jgi:N-acetylglucosamine-6-phosphate deacetylase|nr:N-acetylglucosamine-6-phosphate deacetylase [Acholeplasma sp.]
MLNNLYIVLKDQIVFGDLIIKDGKIVNIHVKPEPINTVKRYVVPGFIDVHIHGASNVDAMDASTYAIEQLALALVKEGTTAFLATTMTQTPLNIENALTSIGHYYQHQNPNGSVLLGVHLEGPFIHEGAAGAQPKSCIIPANIGLFEGFNKASGGIIKKVSLAPDIPGSIDLISYLAQKGIVSSIAHTKASYSTVLEAIQQGASSTTHTYNAMSPLHHRDIGVVGAALLHDELTAELILDKIHVSIPAAKLLIKNKGYQNITLITDSMRAKNMPDGLSELGGQSVIISNGEARLSNGSLAGSILRFIDGFKYALNDLGLSLVEVAYMSSTRAAQQLKVDHMMGSIEIGKQANLVILNDHYNIETTLVNGQVVFGG